MALIMLSAWERGTPVLRKQIYELEFVVPSEYS